MATRTQPCIKCGKPEKFQCSRCKQVYYCSQECQQAHWFLGHKGQCTILSNEAKTELIDKGTTNQYNPPSKFLYPPERAEKILSFDEYSGFSPGLKNIGNSCYLNSVLQCLVHTKPFHNYFKAEKHSTKCNLRKQNKECVICILEDHIDTALDPENYNKIILPRDILLNLDLFGGFRIGLQEDAHEFMVYMLMSLHHAMYEECLLNQVTKRSEPEIEHTTVIYHIFGGIEQSHIKCLTCNNINSSFAPFLDISLPITELSFSLEETLDNYRTIEELHDYTCEKCNKKIIAQKQLTIYKLPNILCLQLKKFDKLNGGRKINRSIVFTETLDLKRLLSANAIDQNASYELYALLVHYGNDMFTGHYTAFVKVGNHWILFDDMKVTPLPNNSVVLKQSPYLLLYKKKVVNVLKPKNPPVVESTKPKETRGGRGRGKRGRGGRGRGGRVKNEKSKEEKPTTLDFDNEEDNESRLPNKDKQLPIKQEPVTQTPLQYKLYYTQDTTTNMIKSPVLKAPLSGIDPKAIMVLVNTSGDILLETKGGPSLSVTLPFKLNVDSCHGTFYIKDSTLACELAVLESNNEEVEERNLQIPITTSELESSSMKLDEDNELDIDSKKEPSKDQDDKKMGKVEQFLSKVAKLNMANLEASYSNLYKEIEKAWAIEEENKAKNGSKLPPEPIHKKKKIDRNDPCPCGSMKKYKQCHGAN